MVNKPKILHVVDTYLPESENWLYFLLKNLDSFNHHIYSTFQSNSKFKNPRFTFHTTPVGRIKENQWKLNKTHPIQLLTWLYYKLKLLFYPNSIAYLNEVIEEAKPQIIHFHFGNVAVEYLQIISRTKIPVIVSFYGLDYEYLPNKFPKISKGYKSLFNENITFICEGNYGKNILIKNGCPSEKIQVLRLGVEVDIIKQRNKAKEKNKLSLLQVASFTEKKGHIYTVKAVQLSLKKCKNLKCILVGDDRDEKTKKLIKDLIVKESLQEFIKVVDFISPENLHSFIENYDVFIHPSCYSEDGDCEGGAPIVLLEAQAIGLPVISTNHCDIPSEVLDGETGLLCEQKNIVQLAEAIEKFYHMPQNEFSKFEMQATEHIKKNFNIKINQLKFKKLYEELMISVDD